MSIDSTNRCICDSHAQVVIPSVNRQYLFIPTTLIPSPGLITVAESSTDVSHMCDNGIVIKALADIANQI